MTKYKLIRRITLYLLIVLCLFLLIKQSGFTLDNLTPEAIKKMAHNNILLILMIMLIIMILQNIFTFIPLVLVIATNIALFGFWKGYLFGCLCSVIGSTLIFLSIRYLFSNAFTSSKAQKYRDKVNKKGFWFVLSGRILPFIPTNLINIASGLSSIKIIPFIVATTIGNMVYGFVLSSASYSVLAAANANILYVLGIIIVAAIIFLFIKLKKKKKKELLIAQENG